jgi:hypothetical protein
MVARENHGPPMTLANKRKNGVRAVIARYQSCGHKADVNVDALPAHTDFCCLIAAQRAKGAFGPPFSFAYAACAAALRELRQPMNPSPKNPIAIITQVDASGTATAGNMPVMPALPEVVRKPAPI